MGVGNTDSARTRQLIVFAEGDRPIAALEPREAHLLADALETVVNKEPTPLERQIRATVAACRRLADMLERPAHNVH
ncbi:MAG: hypothetical protein ACRYHQ_35790 [Janthinobacterium lividum]